MQWLPTGYKLLHDKKFYTFRLGIALFHGLQMSSLTLFSFPAFNETFVFQFFFMHLFALVVLQRDIINTIKFTAVLNIQKVGQAWIKRALFDFSTGTFYLR